MLKTELAVETIGQPSIQALSESEQRTFFETLFASILKLSNNQSKAYRKKTTHTAKVVKSNRKQYPRPNKQNAKPSLKRRIKRVCCYRKESGKSI